MPTKTEDWIPDERAQLTEAIGDWPIGTVVELIAIGSPDNPTHNYRAYLPQTDRAGRVVSWSQIGPMSSAAPGGEKGQ